MKHRTPAKITARITARGAYSATASDEDDGSVDASIFVDGTFVGECTLLPDHAWNGGGLDIWGGDWSCWSNDELHSWIETYAREDEDDGIPESDVISLVVCAVRGAA